MSVVGLAHASANPWVDLPVSAPFVLAEDRAFVDAANANKEPYSAGWLHTGRMPEPRSGPRDAPLVLLQINPSYRTADQAEPLMRADVERQRAALTDEYAAHGCLAHGDAWWMRAFANPIARFGREPVSRRVCSIEYFPYPSLRFEHAHVRLPSQTYQFQLVREALARDALIVVTRGPQLWLGAVPELAARLDRNVLLSRNPQRVSLSPGNLPDGGFERVLGALG
jgi:hypothetical protein